MNFKFDLCVSLDNYTQKPTREECKHIRFQAKTVDADEMVELVKNGYAYTSLMKDNWRCGSNFICSHILTYDIDHSTVEMTKYIEKLEHKPTLAYTSSRNGVEGYGYGFRLVYIIDEEICTMDEYEELSTAFAQELRLTFVDDRSYKGDQMWFGSYGCETYTSYNILKKEYIPSKKWNVKNERHTPLTGVASENKHSVSDTLIQKCKSNYNYTLHHYKVSCTFQSDYENMTFQDFILKYRTVYDNIERTPIELDEDEPIVWYPEGYCEIRRPWKRINGETLKIKDGEGRRRKLFLNGIIRRKINPSITFENLLFNLVYEFEFYYLNNGNKITKNDLLTIAENVMKSDIQSYNDLGKAKYKSFVNPKYCIKYGVTPKQVLGNMRNKKQFIGEFYDPSLKDQENVDIMKRYGLDISIRTLKTWKKENGITKYKKKK